MRARRLQQEYIGANGQRDCSRTSRWLGGLGWYEPHVGSGDCLANGLRVSRIVLLSLDVGLHIGRRHQPHRVTQRLELARPVVSRRAGLDTDQTWRQLLEESQVHSDA